MKHETEHFTFGVHTFTAELSALQQQMMAESDKSRDPGADRGSLLLRS